MRYRLLMARQEWTERTQHGAFARMMDGIYHRQQKLDEQLFRLEKAERLILDRLRRRCETVAAAVRHYDARHQLTAIRQKLEAHVSNLVSAIHTRLLQNRATLEKQTVILEVLSPMSILNRGYALVFDAKGQLIKDTSAIKVHDEISAQLSQGKIRARVTEVKREPASSRRTLE